MSLRYRLSVIAILSGSLGPMSVVTNPQTAPAERVNSDSTCHMLVLNDSVVWGQGLELTFG